MRRRELSRTIELRPFRTVTLPPATHTNSYALGTGEVLLVEPGPRDEGERRRFIAWAEDKRASGQTLVGIFATHAHPDHVGGAAYLCSRLGLPLWAHEATRERLAWTLPFRDLSDGESVTLSGPTPCALTFLHTPGHCYGHLTIHEPGSHTLLVGDMVASVGTILIDPVEGDMAEYLRQLSRLRDLRPRLLLPAHGEPIDAAAARLEQYIAHRNAREAKVLRALSEVYRSEAALLPEVYADTTPLLWPLAIRSLRAHLQKLLAEGHAEYDASRGAWRITQTVNRPSHR